MSKRKKPVELTSVTVTDYAAEGKGLARVDGKVIFVSGAIPGDAVDLFLTKNKKDWAEARVTRMVSPSPDRLTPFCAHFGTCGGCKWQMLPYEKQLQYKEQEATENLRRIGKITEVPVLPILGCAETTAYRNKLEFTFSNKRYITREEINAGVSVEPENALGYHAPRIFDKVIDIDTCYLMDPVNNRIRNKIREWATERAFTFYDIKAHTGWLRNLFIRYTTNGELMVNLCIQHEDEANRTWLLDQLLKEIPEISTLLYTINPKWNDSIYDLNPIVYHGNGYVTERLGDFQFKISPKSFFQTNTFQAKRLYDVVADFAQLSGTETLYDLYCGTGSIGIYLSRGARKLIGVEVIPEAIEDAKQNAALNQINHAEFFAGDVIHICNDAFFETHGRPDIIITDPPRAGMHEKLLQKLLNMEAPKIVYVSCNTATQARDLALLSEKYRVEKLQPVDMFPHTHHIESVALLRLNNQ